METIDKKILLNKLYQYKNNDKSVSLYTFKGKHNFMSNKIKSNVKRDVIINHYTLKNDKLKPITNYNIYHDILIREEITGNGDTLLVEAYIEENRFNLKLNLGKLCDLLSRRLVNLAWQK